MRDRYAVQSRPSLCEGRSRHSQTCDSTPEMAQDQRHESRRITHCSGLPSASCQGYAGLSWGRDAWRDWPGLADPPGAARLCPKQRKVNNPGCLAATREPPTAPRPTTAIAALIDSPSSTTKAQPTVVRDPPNLGGPRVKTLPAPLLLLLFSLSLLQLPASTSSSRLKKAPATKRVRKGYHRGTHQSSSFSTSFPDFCFPRDKSQRIFLVLPFVLYIREGLYEKILSCQLKSSTWTLRPASPSPSASSPRPTRTAKPKPRQRSRLPRSSRSTSPRKPDGKVNTLLLSPPRSLLVASTATPKKRSVLRVKKNVTAVPVSRKSTTSVRNTTGKLALVFLYPMAPRRRDKVGRVCETVSPAQSR